MVSQLHVSLRNHLNVPLHNHLHASLHNHLHVSGFNIKVFHSFFYYSVFENLVAPKESLTQIFTGDAYV